MTTDVSTLEGMVSFEDEKRGIRERFVKLQVGGGFTLGVLSEPLEKGTRAPAWVLCHSFGLEQIALQSIETPIARRLSAAGFPVLRFHAQGYGDSELPVEGVSLQTHVRDTIDATSQLVDMTGAEQVGFIGAKFGGAVAALAAERAGATALAMWHPVVSGRKYIDGLMRQSTLSDIAAYPTGRAMARPDDLAKNLESDGTVDLQGFPVTRDAFEAFQALNLIEQLNSFRGSSLLVQISAVPKVSQDLQRLVERLRQIGGNSKLEVIIHARARVFGMPRFRIHGNSKIDTQADLLEDLARVTVDWSRGLPTARHATISEALP
jgi:pimeloyl-ACP methyl ester carboxylesterase